MPESLKPTCKGGGITVMPSWARPRNLTALYGNKPWVRMPIFAKRPSHTEESEKEKCKDTKPFWRGSKIVKMANREEERQQKEAEEEKGRKRQRVEEGPQQPKEPPPAHPRTTSDDKVYMHPDLLQKVYMRGMPRTKKTAPKPKSRSPTPSPSTPPTPPWHKKEVRRLAAAAASATLPPWWQKKQNKPNKASSSSHSLRSVKWLEQSF